MFQINTENLNNPAPHTMSFFRRSSKRKSKEEEEEEAVDFVVMNSDPSKFVAKVCFAHSHAPQVYTDAGGAQLVRHIAADGRITVWAPPRADPPRRA